MVEFKNISKSFSDGMESKVILNNANIVFDKKKLHGIVGRSGLGKSTVLKMILGIINADSGEIIVDGNVIDCKNTQIMEHIRREVMGSIFQNFNLINALSVEENILLPTFFYKNGKNEVKRIMEILELSNSMLSQSVSTISGGEKQRVSIARALINNPKILIADEPTGNLDQKNENIVIDLFKKIKEELGVTIITVTHSENVASNMDELYTIENGIFVRI